MSTNKKKHAKQKKVIITQKKWLCTYQWRLPIVSTLWTMHLRQICLIYMWNVECPLENRMPLIQNEVWLYNLVRWVSRNRYAMHVTISVWSSKLIALYFVIERRWGDSAKLLTLDAMVFCLFAFCLFPRCVFMPNKIQIDTHNYARSSMKSFLELLLRYAKFRMYGATMAAVQVILLTCLFRLWICVNWFRSFDFGQHKNKTTEWLIILWVYTMTMYIVQLLLLLLFQRFG